MKTNLIFKKQVTVDGALKTITRIVPVEVPFINSGEGWILSGHTDEIEVVEDLLSRIPDFGELPTQSLHQPFRLIHQSHPVALLFSL